MCLDCWERTHHRMLNAFRVKRISVYLETTKYSEILKRIVNDKKFGGIEICKEIFLPIISSIEFDELRERVISYLEFYPTYPGLLMLRSITETFSLFGENILIKQNFNASISSAINEYVIDENVIFEFANWAIFNINKRNAKVAKELAEELLEAHPTRDLARMLLKKLPIELNSLAAWFLLNKFRKKCDKLIIKNED